MPRIFEGKAGSTRAVEPGRYGKAVPYGILGAVVGFGAGLIIVMVSGAMGGEFWWIVLPLFTGISAVGMFFWGAWVIEGSGDLMRRLVMGGKMKPSHQYSYADSLVVRGMYDAAMRAYREAAEEEPGDPEPFLRIGRVLRDKLGRPDDAVASFREARAADRASPQQVNLATREIVETLLYRTEDRRTAIPELARLAEQAAGTKAGDWAQRTLTELKRELAWTIKGGEEDGG